MTSDFTRPSVSVSMRNHAHLAGQIYPYKIAYISNLYHTRTENGFSAPFTLEDVTGLPAVQVMGPDIWADDNDAVHVVWARYTQDNSDFTGQ